MKRYTLFLEADAIDELKALHQRTGVTPSEQIRRAIDRHLTLSKLPASRTDPAPPPLSRRWTNPE